MTATTCPNANCNSGSEPGPTLYVAAALDVSLAVELNEDGTAALVTHERSSDELTGGTLICKLCGWYREMDIDDLRDLLGAPAPLHLSAVTAALAHPTLGVIEN